MRGAAHSAGLQRRREIDYARYRRLHEWQSPIDGGDHEFPHQTSATYRLAAISRHRRIYERS
ncbi:hypothetical protein NS14008_28445 [Nocardia seriolae]|nr:hypothetical protein NS14008_28445 [Nocardia seriolae]